MYIKVELFFDSRVTSVPGTEVLVPAENLVDSNSMPVQAFYKKQSFPTFIVEISGRSIAINLLNKFWKEAKVEPLLNLSAFSVRHVDGSPFLFTEFEAYSTFQVESSMKIIKNFIKEIFGEDIDEVKHL